MKYILFIAFAFLACGSCKSNFTTKRVSSCSDCFIASYVSKSDLPTLEEIVKISGIDSSTVNYFIELCDSCTSVLKYQKMLHVNLDTVFSKNINNEEIIEYSTVNMLCNVSSSDRGHTSIIHKSNGKLLLLMIDNARIQSVCPEKVSYTNEYLVNVLADIVK